MLERDKVVQKREMGIKTQIQDKAEINLSGRIQVQGTDHLAEGKQETARSGNDNVFIGTFRLIIHDS